MKRLLLIVLPLLLIVGCSSDPIDGSTLVRKDGLYYASDANEPYSGKVVFYHDDGKKKKEGTFKDGKEDGLYTEWYENGQKDYEGTYKDGELNGEWTYWHENGQKSDEITYKDGKEIDYKAWDSDGNKQ